MDIVDIFQSSGLARVSMPRLASQLPPPATPSALLIRAERYHLREFPTHSRDSSCPRMSHTRGRSSAKPRPINRCVVGVLSHRRQVVCFLLTLTLHRHDNQCFAQLSSRKAVKNGGDMQQLSKGRVCMKSKRNSMRGWRTPSTRGETWSANSPRKLLFSHATADCWQEECSLFRVETRLTPVETHLRRRRVGCCRGSWFDSMKVKFAKKTPTHQIGPLTTIFNTPVSAGCPPPFNGGSARRKAQHRAGSDVDANTDSDIIFFPVIRPRIRCMHPTPIK